jgi:dipeptidase E
MKKIIAIGGGEIGRPGFPIETTKIDKEIIKLTNKKSPRLLFLPTASGDSESYFQTVEKYFGKKLKCKVDVLYLSKTNFSKNQVRDTILSSDIIYVGGGNTLKMIKIWKKIGVDKSLKEAYEKGVILSGLSAGAICWFKYGNSDSLKMKDKKAPSIRVSGLGFIPALFCPHYNFEKYRKPELKKMMMKNSGVAIAIDNCCAIEIIEDTYRIISSKDSANAYRVFWSKGKFHHELILKSNELKTLSNLLDKKKDIC